MLYTDRMLATILFRFFFNDQIVFIDLLDFKERRWLMLVLEATYGTLLLDVSLGGIILHGIR